MAAMRNGQKAWVYRVEKELEFMNMDASENKFPEGYNGIVVRATREGREVMSLSSAKPLLLRHFRRGFKEIVQGTKAGGNGKGCWYKHDSS